MKLLIEPVPHGSHAFRGWRDVPPGDHDTGEPIDVVGLIQRISGDECKIAMTKGELTRGMLLLLVDKARLLGYQKLIFARAGTGAISRWATLVRCEDGLSVYEVDLTTMRPRGQKKSY